MATVLTLLSVAATAVVMIRDGGSLGFVHDSLDFVAFVRRMLETGRIDILSGAYANTEGMGADARRGAFHFGMTLVCAVTRVDPTEMWRWLPSFLSPLAIWIFFAAFRRVLNSARSAGLAVFFFTASLLFAPEHFLHNLAYASRLGWIYSLVGLWAVALFLDIEQTDRTPPGGWKAYALPPHKPGRPGKIPALLTALGGAILLGVHVLSAAQYIYSVAAFAWVRAWSRRDPRPVRRWLWLLPIGALAAALPFLALKLLQSYSTANPFFDHTQGLLYVFGDAAVLMPDRIAAWFGWPGVLALILIVPLIPRILESRAITFLVGSTLASLLVLFNPVATAIIEKAGAHSLLFRMLYVFPLYPILGFYGDWALRRLTDPIQAWRRVLAVAYLGLLAVFCFMELRSAQTFLSKPSYFLSAWSESVALRDALQKLERLDTQSGVVLADPVTSYQIPAFSHFHAVAPLHQHSSPSDDRAGERMRHVRAALNPFVSMDETLRILRQYDVHYVLLNHSFPGYVREYMAFIQPEAFETERVKFDSQPSVFRPVLEEAGIIVYLFQDPGPEFQDPGIVNPYLILRPEQTEGLSAEEICGVFGAEPLGMDPVEGLEPLGIVWNAPAFETGDYVKVTTYWRRTGPPRDLPVESFYRFETQFPNERFYHPLTGKPYRRWYEQRNGVTYRFGRFHRPLEGIFPSFLWEEGAVYEDEFWIPIPRHAAPGLYKASIKLQVQPFSPNLRLADYFNVRDSLDGYPVGEVRIMRPTP